jgi:hypothetical protein
VPEQERPAELAEQERPAELAEQERPAELAERLPRFLDDGLSS